MKKRVGRLLISLMLCLSLLSAAALAASSSGSLTSTASKQVVMLGTGSPLGFDSNVGYNGTYDELYFGTYYADMTSEDAVGRPHLWRILDGETSDPTNPDGLFLLSTDGYSDVRFTLPRADENTESWWLQPHNDWSSSLCSARLWCGEMAKSAKVFSDAERGALLVVSKASERYQPTSTSYFKQLYGSVQTGALTNEKVFYLSAKEFEDPRYGLTENGGEIGVYPLRSAADGASYDSDAGKIYDGMIASGSNRVDVLPTYTKLYTGSSYSEELTATEKFFFDGIMDFSFFPDFGATEEYVCEYNAYTAHPAMNLSGEKLLYITAADNSGHQNYGTLADDSDNWEWKAVLTDSNTAFKSQVALTNAPRTISSTRTAIRWRSAIPR